MSHSNGRIIPTPATPEGGEGLEMDLNEPIRSSLTASSDELFRELFANNALPVKAERAGIPLTSSLDGILQGQNNTLPLPNTPIAGSLPNLFSSQTQVPNIFGSANGNAQLNGSINGLSSAGFSTSGFFNTTSFGIPGLSASLNGQPPLRFSSLQTTTAAPSIASVSTASSPNPAPQPTTPAPVPLGLSGSAIPIFASALSQPPSQVLVQVFQHVQEQEDKLRQILHDQQQLLQNPTEAAYNALVQHQQQLKTQMDQEVKLLQHINSAHLLEPPDLARLVVLQHEVVIQQKQLELYQGELQLLAQPSPNPPVVACLVIKKQPFPMAITKGKQLSEEQLQVQLLTGANVNFTVISQCKASLISDQNAPSSKNPSAPLEFDTQNVSLSQRVSMFPLKFSAGTRKCAVNLKFGVQVRTANGAVTTIESDLSEPFVVITNECQWEGSARTLLKKDAFGNQLEVAWGQFANALQRHFLVASRQDHARPKRALSPYDFQYINTSFFDGRQIIHQKDFENFWGWFGKTMQTLRYQRHIAPLWQNGIIYGYIKRTDADAALHGQEPGTFIIRFSENNHGQFGIAYITAEQQPKVRHYLVQPNDTAAAKKTFPDFLAECPQFVYLLQLTTDANGRQQFLKLHKDIALEPYASKRHHAPTLGGYEPLNM